MQEKVNALTDILKTIKNERQRKYALSIVIDLVSIINNQSNEIKGLMAYKTNNKISDVECELQKYIYLLITFGYSQQSIKCIRPEALMFIAKHRNKINDFSPQTIKNIDLQMMLFETEKGVQPKNIDELKNYINESKG